MKIKIHNLLILLTFLVSSLAVVPTFAVGQSNYEYNIQSYDVNIKVNEDNTLQITEQISANFNVKKHGIFRTIPLVNKITRLDGTRSTVRAKIRDIRVNDNYSKSYENSSIILKIGSENKTYIGEKNYSISYVYDLGKDKNKKFDELYFNIIGTEWDTTIDNVSFSITMPKEFDKSLVGFSSGIYGSTDNSNITYQVQGDTISGSYVGTLGIMQGITVRLQLPDQYFVRANQRDNWSIAVIIISILLTAISADFWRKYKKKEVVIETVEFYPPAGFNSVEVAYLYRGYVKNTDVVSLLIYLANEGYIKIIETNEKKDSKSFVLKKLKDYEGNNGSERTFMNGLFSKKDEVTARDLKNKFYVTVNKVIKGINDKKEKFNIYDKVPRRNRSLMIFFTFLIGFLTTIKPLAEYTDGGIGFITSIFVSGIMTACFYLLLHKKIECIVSGVFVGIILAIIWFALVWPALEFEKIFSITYGIGFICMFVIVFFFRGLPVRTDYGNEMLGKIRGFRRFLITAEKPRLEALVMENPTYFYHILPYTYVLGLSDKWIKKFETIVMDPPGWYDSPNMFNMYLFSSFMHSTMTTATNTMTTTPGGGGGTGGGFSGGGTGGGGGGSW